MPFAEELHRLFYNSLNNDYPDNYDHLRFGKERKKGVSGCLKSAVTACRKFFGQSEIEQRTDRRKQFYAPLEYLYQLVADDESRRLIVMLMAYRLLGHRKVKLPLNDGSYWQKIAQIDSLADKKDAIVTSSGERLSRYNLSSIGYDLSLYYNSSGILIDYVLKQYELRRGDLAMKAKPGDWILDAGGCWGDTALYFAAETGNSGKVYTFEFVPGNLEVLKKNLALNAEVASTVTVVERPLSDRSGVTFQCADNGPGSHLSQADSEDNGSETTTLAIDNFMEEYRVKKVDFIKMDIEGSELQALQGGERTIRKFRPKLAIAIYHTPEDPRQIPQYLDSLGLGYRFHVGHYTIHCEETMLYAYCQD